MTVYGERIKKLRNKKRMDQTEFANLIGENDRYQIGKYENEKAIPDLLAIKNICEKCGNVSADYILGFIDEERHDLTDICSATGLSPKAVQMLELINKEAKVLNYESYSFGDKKKNNIIGTEKTLRVINELLENEYDRFIENGKTGFMDNLFTAIDEYMHPADFEFCVFDKKAKKTIIGQHIPQILDKSIGAIDPIPEEEIYRNIIMDRIQKMLMNLKYDMESATVAENIKKKGRKNNENNN